MIILLVKAATTVAVVGFALTATGTAYSKNMVMPPREHLTLAETIKWQKQIIKHDRWVIRTSKSHNPSRVSFAERQLRWTILELRQSLRSLSRSVLLYGMPLSSASLPQHHSLWLCIHSFEAGDWHNNDTGHNGHYGGLQMHPGWGYGTSYYASADSQYQQEMAAERGYRASGFSTAWLMRQWYHPECLRYA